jgi:hypothetical protein
LREVTRAVGADTSLGIVALLHAAGAREQLDEPGGLVMAAIGCLIPRGTSMDRGRHDRRAPPAQTFRRRSADVWHQRLRP